MEYVWPHTNSTKGYTVCLSKSKSTRFKNFVNRLLGGKVKNSSKYGYPVESRITLFDNFVSE